MLYLTTNLIYLRKSMSLSYYQLGKLADMPHTTIFQLEKGITKDPYLSTVIKLAKVFDVSVDAMLFKNLSG